MKIERKYRSLRRGLILFLVAVLILMYFYNRRYMSEQAAIQQGTGFRSEGYMGVMQVSDVMNGGCVYDEFSFTAATSLEKGTQFNENVQLLSGEIRNVSEVPVTVQMQISATDIGLPEMTNAGLSCFFYYFKEYETDPVEGNVQKYLKDYQSMISEAATAEEENGRQALALYEQTGKYPTKIFLDPGESYQLRLAVWIDYDRAVSAEAGIASVLPGMETQVQDETFNKRYSITVKLLSRSQSLVS